MLYQHFTMIPARIGKRKMTNKEAIKFAKENILAYTSEMSEFKALAIEAIEKHIPKKPIKSDREIRYCEVWKCPSCGFEWSSRVVDYCYRCGQRIDWQEIDWE